MINKFKTQEEVWKALLDGKVIVGEIMGDTFYYKFIDGEIRRSYTIDGIFTSSICTFLCVEHFNYREYVPEPNWYDDLPVDGYLCKVWDEHDDIVSYDFIIDTDFGDAYKFIGVNNTFWMNAVPVSPEDAMKFIYQKK